MVSGTAQTSALTELDTTTVWCSQMKSRQLTFSWNAVTGAESYIVQTGTTSTNFSSNIIVAGTSLNITNLEPDTTYYIRVRAKAGSDSEYSDCQT